MASGQQCCPVYGLDTRKKAYYQQEDCEKRCPLDLHFWSKILEKISCNYKNMGVLVCMQNQIRPDQSNYSVFSTSSDTALPGRYVLGRIIVEFLEIQIFGYKMACRSFILQKFDNKNQLNKTPRPPGLADKSCPGCCLVFYQVESSA